MSYINVCWWHLLVLRLGNNSLYSQCWSTVGLSKKILGAECNVNYHSAFTCHREVYRTELNSTERRNNLEMKYINRRVDVACRASFLSWLPHAKDVRKTCSSAGLRLPRGTLPLHAVCHQGTSPWTNSRCSVGAARSCPGLEEALGIDVTQGTVRPPALFQLNICIHLLSSTNTLQHSGEALGWELWVALWLISFKANNNVKGDCTQVQASKQLAITFLANCCKEFCILKAAKFIHRKNW